MLSDENPFTISTDFSQSMISSSNILIWNHRRWIIYAVLSAENLGKENKLFWTIRLVVEFLEVGGYQ